jgi:hypothetical protein
MRTTEPLNHTASGPPHLGDAAVEIVPVISTVFAAGPPVLLAWLGTVVLALLLAGPFLLIVTLVIVFVAVVGLVLLAGAILASPYLLIRHLSRHAAQRERASEGRAPIAPVAVRTAR